LEIASCMT